MLAQLALALALAADPAAAPAAAVSADKGPVKLAAPGLKAVNISEGDAQFYSDHLAQQLKLLGLSVSTASDIGALLGLERQKQLLGCGDDSASCVAELAGALGADGIVTGSLGKFGPVYQINLNILAAGGDGSSIAVFSSRVTGEEPLLDEFTKAARQMAREVYVKLGRPLPEALLDKPSPLRRFFWVPAAVGVASAGAGAFFLAQSRDKHAALTAFDTAKVGSNSAAYAQSGATEQTVGVTLLSVGAAGLVASGVMYLLGAPPPPVSGAVSVTPSGGKVFIEGELPW